MGAGDILQRARHFAMRRLDIDESDEALAKSAGEYWNGDATLPGVDLRDHSHWRGAGTWSDDERWWALGRAHLDLVDRFARLAGGGPSFEVIVEWGSGGGANAVHLAPRSRRFYGIEVSQSNLVECGRVLREQGFEGFRPVLIPSEYPERALDAVAEPADFFLCTYVFELLPGTTYGLRVLQIAERLLRSGGAALIQIRYDDGTPLRAPKRRDYFTNAVHFTSYPLHTFWLEAERAGFVPEAVQLIPTRGRYPHTGGQYAYFFLRKP